MLYLAVAILGSGAIPAVFRGFDRLGVNLFWAIPANYAACIVIGTVALAQTQSPSGFPAQPWFPFAGLQGFLLAVNFYLLAYTAQRVGVAVAALASRLSVAIPSILAFGLYGDSVTAVKIAGLGAALLALYLCTAPNGNGGASRALAQLLPASVFLTFGAYFTILKYLQVHYLDLSWYHAYVMTGFVFAFLTSLTIGVHRNLFSGRDFRAKHISAGALLGAVNYIAVYALLRVLALEGWQSSQIFPIYSVGVVAVSAILALLCFRERLSSRRSLGLAAGLLAVALLNR